MSSAALLVLSALVSIHESTLSPLTGPDYTRGYVRGIDSVGVDPAAVAGEDGFAFQYRHRILRDEGGLGRLGAVAALPLYRFVLYGGYEWNLIPHARFEQGTVGLAGVISERLWAGVSLRQLSSPHRELRGSIWHLGLYSELFSWLSLSAGIDGFNRPGLLGGEIRPDYVLGASVRPIVGEPWLTLGGEARVGAGGQRDYQISFSRAVVDVSPYEGVHLTSAYGRVLDDLPVGSPLVVAQGHELWFGMSLALGGLEARASSAALRLGDNGHRLNREPLLADNQLALTVRFAPSESVFRPGGRAVEVPLVEKLHDAVGVIDPGSPIATVLYHLDHAADDPTVGTVLLPLGKLDVGMGTVDELRGVIKRLRGAGKTVIATLSTADDKTYAVAAACDYIRMDPSASMVLDGFAVPLRYYAGALAKIGVTFEAVGVGNYKTGPDSLTRTGPRPEEIEVQRQIVGQAYGTLMTALTEDRALSREQAETVIAKAVFTAAEARAAGLVDEMTAPSDPKEVPPLYPAGQALERVPPPSRRWSQRPIIRVIPVVGTIVANASDNILPGPSATAADLVPEIEDATEDGDVAAVVLRIDSPGGDVLASDVIWRAVRRLAESKPVVVSMGDVAASGGYYVAAPAHKIFAQPNTVTGSIGIFVVRAQLAGLFEKLDIHSEIVKEGPHSDFDLVERPLQDDDRRRIENNLRAYYDTFVSKVAVGRGMSVEKVRGLAEGRVYTGAAAKELGLVDTLGGLGDALREAQALAGLPSDADIVIELPKSRRSLTRLLLNLTGLAQSEQSSLTGWLGETITRLTAWDGRALAMLPIYYRVDP